MNSVTRIEPPQESAAAQPLTLLAYLRAAESGADLERLEKLMGIHEKWEANEARKAFEAAMADFRSESMVILKTKYVDMANGPKFWHAQLADACDAIIPNLSKYGLRHRWKTEQPNGRVKITCVISHRLGHSEETSLDAPPDKAGNKSDIHAVASAAALLERYTLFAATGLAAKAMDSNPRGTGVPDPVTDQADNAPGDYENWKADATAITDEGSARLQDLWAKTPADIRRYVVKNDKSWWDDMKARAAKVTKRASVQS